MEHTILRQKLQTLAAFPDMRPAAVTQFGDILTQLTAWEFIRINPLRFAEQHGLDAAESLNLFIHGAKIGLFDFAWNLICPACGSILKSHSSIGAVERDRIHCAVCDVDLEVDLSAFVEVAFSLDPAVGLAPLNPFADYASYRAYFFSPNYQIPPDLAAYLVQHCFKGFYLLPPDETLKIRLTAQPRERFRLSSPDSNALLRLTCTPETATLPQIADVDLVAGGFSPDAVELPAGELTLNITSHLPRPTGLQLIALDPMQRRHFELLARPTFLPFVTGKMLLNNQSFRDLFRMQTLPRDLQLKVSNTTILFTDLKGSTALYEKTGDMTAYNLVQTHFELLKAATRKHAGAIIKTIGDAIMAAFSNPADGVRSALDMVESIRRMNLSGNTYGEEIAIKVGLNAGTALAVTANEMLDYFGQSVNLAARVQGLAEGGEIWLTDAIYNDEIQHMLTAAQYRIVKQSALLKGVSTPTTVYQCFR